MQWFPPPAIGVADCFEFASIWVDLQRVQVGFFLSNQWYALKSSDGEKGRRAGARLRDSPVYTARTTHCAWAMPALPWVVR